MGVVRRAHIEDFAARHADAVAGQMGKHLGQPRPAGEDIGARGKRFAVHRHRRLARAVAGQSMADTQRPALAHERSEEHTSELQSLMRISYAVFCLKKKNTKNATVRAYWAAEAKHERSHLLVHIGKH